MMKNLILIIAVLLTTISMSFAKEQFAKDDFNTNDGKFSITFIGHGTLMIEYKGKVIHIDPWTEKADYTKLPKADLILITHFHFDHLDSNAVKLLKKSNTKIILPQTCYDILKEGKVMKNGDKTNELGIGIEAFPAYNTTEGRDKFHPKGRDNGYILTIGNKRIYIAGDTENIPEMADLKNIDIAFLPMNQPYTMLPEQVEAAAKSFNPKILYPYHFGETDLSIIKNLMKYNKNIELRLRDLK